MSEISLFKVEIQSNNIINKIVKVGLLKLF